MGDVLHALPAVTALRRALPEAHIGWAIEPRWRALLSPELVDAVHEVPTRDWKEAPVSLRTLRQILALRREFRAADYDVAIDLQGSLRSAFLARLSGAPRVFGAAEPRETPARTFYTHRVGLHQVSVVAQAVELVNAATGLALQAVAPVVGAVAEGVSTGGVAFVLISPTAGWGAKQWPVAAYNELIERLEAAGHTVLVNAGQAEDPTAKAVARGTRARVVATSLADFITLTRGAALVIGGDTGPVHLAAALGVPTLALFGPTDPARNGPHFPGGRATILRHPASVNSYKRYAAAELGLRSITVEEVYDAALALLDARTRNP
jgi:heptosyltransferase-1